MADAGKLAPGIPKSNFWASDPDGINQVGCVHTAQGSEFSEWRLRIGQRRPHHPARVAGLRVKSTPLTTMPHTRPMAGETKRE